jgi:hypothetical protein
MTSDQRPGQHDDLQFLDLRVHASLCFMYSGVFPGRIICTDEHWLSRCLGRAHVCSQLETCGALTLVRAAEAVCSRVNA